MKPSELCVSKDTAILLRDKGLKQGDSYFVWFKYARPENDSWSVVSRNFANGTQNKITIAAPTVSELLKEFTNLTITKSLEDGLIACSENCIITQRIYFYPEALAALWLKLNG
jgi:hypothetical protein